MDNEFKHANRFSMAILMACKFCKHCSQELAKVISDRKMDMDIKVKEVLELREDCPTFQDEEYAERDTTYPGATYAPHDNNHPNLLADSSDIDHNPHQPKRCLNQLSTQPYIPKLNRWDKCLSQLFDRKRPVAFPSPTVVMEMLATSQIPQYTFKIGLPPQRGMGFDRGLWFYRSEKFNSALEKNTKLKGEMKKIVMVYLYHVWFKKLAEETKIGIFMALETADKYSLASDLSWWMLNVFHDESALLVHPPEDELEFEFIPISIMDKAQEAAMVAAAGCEDSCELDIEAQEYDRFIEKFGFKVVDEWTITDPDGKEIY